MTATKAIAKLLKLNRTLKIVDFRFRRDGVLVLSVKPYKNGARCPVLFVCANNGYAMGTALGRSESQLDLMKRLSGYKLTAASVGGMDVVAV